MNAEELIQSLKKGMTDEQAESQVILDSYNFMMAQAAEELEKRIRMIGELRRHRDALLNVVSDLQELENNTGQDEVYILTCPSNRKSDNESK